MERNARTCIKCGEALTPTRKQPNDGLRAVCLTCGWTFEDYNGWANRETWATFTQISSYETWDQHARELVRLAQRQGKRAEDVLRGWVEAMTEPGAEEPEKCLLGLSVAMDIGSLWRVDWVALAEAFLE